MGAGPEEGNAPGRQGPQCQLPGAKALLALGLPQARLAEKGLPPVLGFDLEARESHTREDSPAGPGGCLQTAGGTAICVPMLATSQEARAPEPLRPGLSAPAASTPPIGSAKLLPRARPGLASGLGQEESRRR